MPFLIKMRFNHNLIQSYLHRTELRLCSSKSAQVPFVKVTTKKGEETIKINFRYAHIPNLRLVAPKTEIVQTLLSQIKRMAEVQLKYSISTSHSPENVDVSLLHKDNPIDTSTLNKDAWIIASSLKIGDKVYEIRHNYPTVTELTLPKYILPGCFVRPHVIFDSAELSDSEFVWYRSFQPQEADELQNGKDDTILVEGKWLRVGEGLIYHVTSEDAGHYLKVVCTPKLENISGLPSDAASCLPVESEPLKFPFEDRQLHTQSYVGDDSIRCVSYNILADIYVKDRKKFPYATEKAKDFKYRKQVLIKELMGYKSDVICLQECQDRTFEIDLFPVFKQLGFSGFYKKKGGAQCEGLATFVRDAKFKVIFNYGILLNLILKEKNKHIFVDLITKVAGNYKDMSKLLAQDNALQILLLEHVNQPNKKLLIANTHLYSNKHNPEVRLLQAAICTYYIDHVIKRKDLQSVPVLFCGDFNSLPDSDAVRFMLSGKYECCPSWKNNSGTVGDTVLRHCLNFDSACGIPEYTNYTEEFQGCLDYIFYSNNYLKVSDIVPVPSHEVVTANVALPSELFPSDHMALVCTLQWKNS